MAHNVWVYDFGGDWLQDFSHTDQTNKTAQWVKLSTITPLNYIHCYGVLFIMDELLKFIDYQKATYERRLKYEAERDTKLYTEKELAMFDVSIRCDKQWIHKLELLVKGEYVYL